MSLKTQVESYAGAITDNVALVDWLLASARTLINLLPEEEVAKLAVGVIADVDVSKGRVADVVRAGVSARYIPYRLLQKALTPGSIYQASVTDPVYSFDARGVVTVPEAGVNELLVRFLAFPETVNINGITLDPLPVQFLKAIILSAAVSAMSVKTQTAAIARLAGVGLPQLTVPTAPEEVVGSFTAPWAEQIEGVTVTSPGDPPVFNAALASVPTIRFSAIAPSASDIPGAPNFTFTDASTTNLVAMVSGMQLDLAASFSKAVQFIDSEHDVELAMVKLSEIRERINQFQANLQSLTAGVVDAARLSNDTEKFNRASELDEQVKQYQANLQRFAASVELYQAQIAKEREEAALTLQAWATDRQTTLTQELNRFNASASAYQSALQMNIEQARLNAQRAAAQAQLSTDVSVKAKSLELEAQLGVFKANLERYSSMMSGYQVQVQSAVAEMNANLQSALAQVQVYQKQTEFLQALYEKELALTLGKGKA